jgi:hypothetical protein
MNFFQFVLLLLPFLLFHIPCCICLGNWTWMYGDKIKNSLGFYGEIGVPNPSNIPRARYLATSCYDKNSGTLWLFGGNIGDQGKKLQIKRNSINHSLEQFNDLWKFDGLYWTLMSGTNLTLQKPIFGDKGVPSKSNILGGRSSSVSWVDNEGSFWIFGGHGYDNGKESYNKI